MSQAKGVLPKGDDREVLYRNPQMCGYFIGIGLADGLSPQQVLEWLSVASSAVDALVVREVPTEVGLPGRRVASVAVGYSRTFFERLNAQGEKVEPPAGFQPSQTGAQDWFPGMPPLEVDVLFYVASVMETRISEFIGSITTGQPIQKIVLERGYQRADETEHFGYRDGVRNVELSDRSRIVFVHTDGEQPDEPAWADGGSYMAIMKISQNLTAFTALGDETARDRAIGRTKAGERLDLVGQGIDPHDETAPIGDAVPPSAHIRKAGPRGLHDDVAIFRRGLPFIEVDGEAEIRVGLQFASFQARPRQFDVVLNEWMLNTRFPTANAGVDALMTSPITEVLHAQMFFVAPYDEAGLAAALKVGRGKPDHGRLVVTKVIVDTTGGPVRFARGGFHFRILDSQTNPVPGAEMTTNRALPPVLGHGG